jgi:hypothetical protein
MRTFLCRFGLLMRQCCAILFFFCTGAQAQTTLESIPLQYQNAQSVADQLSPQLKLGEYAVASGNSILVNAETSELARYRALIAALDLPMKRWLLEMRQGKLALLQKEGGAEGDVTISNRGANGVVMIGNASSEPQNRTVSQSLQVQEGVKAPIALGNPKPLTLRTTVARADGSLSAAASGLQVLEQSGLWAVLYQRDARTVTLEIAPRSAASSELMLGHTSAVLSLPLGQWTTLAEADAAQPDQGTPYVVQARLTLLP